MTDRFYRPSGGWTPFLSFSPMTLVALFFDPMGVLNPPCLEIGFFISRFIPRATILQPFFPLKPVSSRRPADHPPFWLSPSLLFSCGSTATLFFLHFFFKATFLPPAGIHNWFSFFLCFGTDSVSFLTPSLAVAWTRTLCVWRAKVLNHSVIVRYRWNFSPSCSLYSTQPMYLFSTLSYGRFLFRPIDLRIPALSLLSKPVQPFPAAPNLCCL